MVGNASATNAAVAARSAVRRSTPALLASGNDSVPEVRYSTQSGMNANRQHLRASQDRLPSGRHGLTRETIVASQRGRLLDAMAAAVAEKGYAETTVSDVVDRAGVSRRTFYEQF